MLSHLSQLCSSFVSTTWNISHFSRIEAPSPCLQVNLAADLSYTGNQTGNNHMASIMWQSALNILCDIHWDDVNSSLITSSSLINTLTQIHAVQPFVNLCSICYMTDDDWGTRKSSVFLFVLPHITAYKPTPPTYHSIPLEILDFQSPAKAL